MSQEHLDHNAVSRAVVDGESILEQEHLAQCAVCRGQAEKLGADLAELGRRSRETAPQPSNAFAWSDASQTSRFIVWKWLWSPAAGAIVAAALLAVVWLGFSLDSPSPEPFRRNQALPLAEIMDMEPEPLGGFAGFFVAENSPGLEQDFISADDDEDFDAGAQGVILWSGVL